LFLVMSLAGGAGRLLDIHENNKRHLLNNTRLCILSTQVLIMAVAHAKQPTYNSTKNKKPHFPRKKK
ncbi:hypothetical protein ACVGW2_07415, partial [Enterobacter intestinihominis]